jgi:hypothetical protein
MGILDLEIESKAMGAIKAAVANNGQGLVPAVTHAINTVSNAANWTELVGVMKQFPHTFVRDSDEKFYKNCPKDSLADFISGDNGILSQLINRLGDSNRKEWKLDGTDIRLMHVLVDSLLTLGQTAKLKKVAEMLYKTCTTRFVDDDGNPALIPGAVYHKLAVNNIVQKQSPNGSGKRAVPARPIRNIENDDPAASPQHEKLTGATHYDDHPVRYSTSPDMPKNNGKRSPDHSLQAQLAAAAAIG